MGFDEFFERSAFSIRIRLGDEGALFQAWGHILRVLLSVRALDLVIGPKAHGQLLLGGEPPRWGSAFMLVRDIHAIFLQHDC